MDQDDLPKGKGTDEVTSAPTEDFQQDSALFTPGNVIGRRYQVQTRLGQGGMGEVWRAFDLKLRVEVALKALHPAFLDDHRGLELLRREVRAARDVISANVCRIFDLNEANGHEFISMEYVDGTTLREVLSKRGPLELREASEISSQMLAGLQAIHDAGLIHRDLKPENIMLTRTGRVVIMDLGLARSITEPATGSISGTPGYMPPEQVRGETCDGRADVFSAGVVLVEMTSPDGVPNIESRKSLWEGVRRQPPSIPDSPWVSVLGKAVASDPEQRHPSPRDLARALDEVTLRVEGSEDLHPYPGLASFTKEDAEYFFGREAEVEALWRKLDRPRLMAVVGPSGAGKSSFLRAGLLSSEPASWAHVLSTPGDAPFRSLGQALVPEIASDTTAIQQLLGFQDPDVAVSIFSQWRSMHDEALVVIDQFEELFTLNPVEVQVAFAALLRRLVLEADVYVLLSLRDDFLLHCRRHEDLAPIFSDLVALLPPTGDALRRALVQPAVKCGFHFEHDGLVDEMLAEVEGERGALPMLAFATACLWERRDRQEGHLTREAYETVGGVGGSLAQHAEATLESIGSRHRDLVRELFRNLVTAEGTRAVREVDDLLSVFSDREAAEEVLRQLISARLLTSFDSPSGEDGEGGRRVEIIHESLLEAWPRLVRWRTQDADGAQFRDQLRQAAKAWDDRGRPDDLLWSGTAFLEHKLWRQTYPGGLSAIEDAFSQAMTAHAGRKKRRRRLVVGTAFVVLLFVLGAFAALWLGSEAQTRRAEAAQVLMLGRLALDDQPSATLAHTIASLELDDDPTARRLAVEALWRSPPTTYVGGKDDVPHSVCFSPDGRWLAMGGRSDRIGVWSQSGGAGRFMDAHEGGVAKVVCLPDSKTIASAGTRDRTIRFWSLADGRLVREAELGGRTVLRLALQAEKLFTFTVEDQELLVQVWPSMAAEARTLGRIALRSYYVDTDATLLAFAEGGTLATLPVDDFESATPSIIGNHPADITTIAFFPDGRRLASADELGQIRIWSLEGDNPELERIIQGQPRSRIEALRIDPQGTTLVSVNYEKNVWLWRLDDPPGTEPLELRGQEGLQTQDAAFDPSGQWIALAEYYAVSLWPLSHRYPAVLRVSQRATGMTLAPDASWVARIGAGGLWIWSLDGSSEPHHHEVNQSIHGFPAAHPDGVHVVAGSDRGPVYVLPLAGGDPRVLEGFGTQSFVIAVSPNGRLVAAGGGQISKEDAVIRLWDLSDGLVRTLDPGDGTWICGIEFISDDRMISASGSNARIWDLSDGSSEILRDWDEGTCGHVALSRNGRHALTLNANLESGSANLVAWHDLITGESKVLPVEIDFGFAVALDPSGQIAAHADLDRGTKDFVIRVGEVDAQEHNLLFGTHGFIWALEFTPDGKRLLSADDSGAIHIWHVPYGCPFQTLPLDELLERLRSLTNYRAVKDDRAPSGYRLETAEFNGWQHVPSW